MITVRDTIIMSFGVDDARVRTLRIPDPDLDIDAATASLAGGILVNAGIFESPLRMYDSAELERVETRVVL